MLRTLARYLLMVVIVVAAAGAAPEDGQWSTESLLMIQGQADSVDFRLIDPLGRVAVIAVDSAMSAIPECTVEKSSDNPYHDDSEWDPDSIDLRPYGGGVFVLKDPQAGVWHLDVLAARGCEDSCGVDVNIWSMKRVNDSWDGWLRPGEETRWRLTLIPLPERETRVWARMELERGPRFRHW